MIFLQILIFVVSIIFISLSISGFGKIFHFSIKRNFFFDIFLGLTAITFLITFIHFFLRINTLIGFFILILGIIIFYNKKNLKFKQLLKIKNINYVIIFLLLVPIYLSQKYHEDFGYYHLPFAIGLIEEKIIFGFSNIDQSYVYNSIWLNLYSFFL